jgi:hypothetical protein
MSGRVSKLQLASPVCIVGIGEVIPKRVALWFGLWALGLACSDSVALAAWLWRGALSLGSGFGSQILQARLGLR